MVRSLKFMYSQCARFSNDITADVHVKALVGLVDH